MDRTNLELVGQGIAAIGAIALGIIAFIRGHKKSDGAPPPDRRPAENEVKAALTDLKERLVAIDGKIDRHSADLGDDAADIRKDIERLERQLDRLRDRLDADARIGTALARMGRADG